MQTKPRFQKLKQRLARPAWSAMVVLCFFVFTSPLAALNSRILTPWYDPEICDPTQNDGPGNAPTNDSEKAIAKTIMGIAKTYNLGQKGARIGLITALVESNLKVYANDKVPISLEKPHDAVAHDHDSVGVFQQRPTAGWSTFSKGGNESLTNKDAVWQLMDVAYSAQAFFGTPPDAKLPPNLVNPHAIQKGLQNIRGWETMDEGAAAQKVQVSAFPDRYAKRLPQAQKLINDLWNDAPAVPLPISVTGGSGNTPDQDQVGTCTLPNAQGNLFQTIVKYAWPNYRPKGSSGAMERKPEYVAAINAAIARNNDAREHHQGAVDYIGGCLGIDCGGFITRIMRDSGVDPKYNSYLSNTDAQWRYLREHPEKYDDVSVLLGRKASGTGDLKPGDIAVNNEHTYMYVGTIPGFNGNSASASYCGRAPMASKAYDFTSYAWYRFKGALSPETQPGKVLYE